MPEEDEIEPDPEKAKAGRKLLATIERDMRRLTKKAEKLEKTGAKIPTMTVMSFMKLEQLKCWALAKTRLREGATGDEAELCKLVLHVINENDL